MYIIVQFRLPKFGVTSHINKHCIPQEMDKVEH